MRAWANDIGVVRRSLQLTGVRLRPGGSGRDRHREWTGEAEVPQLDEAAQPARRAVVDRPGQGALRPGPLATDGVAGPVRVVARRREGEQVTRILEVGASLREAQAAMSGDDLRALTRQRRQVTAAITQQARSLASEAGVKVTSSVADQVEATLTAAMLDERCAQAVRSGLLS